MVTRRPNNLFGNHSSVFDNRVFTTAFDATVGEQCDEEELAQLYALFGEQLANLYGLVGRLANRLRRRTMTQPNRSWDST
jgi:cobaltochelatase CobT